MKEKYLVLCDSWNEAYAVYQKFATVMRSTKELKNTDFNNFTVYLKDGSIVSFTGKKDRYIATKNFKGIVIKSWKFYLILNSYANNKEVML